MSKGFVSRLSLDEHVKGGKSVPGEWVLRKNLAFITANGRRFVAPRGFITDLASIPKLLRNVIDVNGKHRRAAVLHDYLYVTQQVTRAEADALFLEAMEVLEVGKPTRLVMWAAVRAGGWIYWNKRAKAADTSGDFVPDGYFTDA